MTNPQRFINRVLLFLLLVGGVVALVSDVVWRAFMHNPALNGLIIGVLLLGIVYAMRRIFVLKSEVRWIEAFRTSGPGFSLQDAPLLLSPVAAALGERERRGRTVLSAVSMRYLLDSLSARLEESRDITRYQAGLLIFLGLLGTFWGLIETINAVALVLDNLTLAGDDLATMFDSLKAGLAAPINGMGTAFSSSLFGLSGSLVLGFIDLQASQAQNAFYNDTEEWLSTLTRHSGLEGGIVAEGLSGGAPSAYTNAMLQQMAENLDSLRQSLHRSEEGRMQLNGVLVTLNDRLGTLAERMAHEQDLLRRFADGRGGREGEGDLMREHVRGLDAKLGRLLDEVARGRQETLRELKGEIRQVSRTIAIVAGEPQSIGR